MVFTTALRDREWSKFKNINNEPAIRVTSTIDGNPYVIETDLATTDTNYDVDVNANLGRNGHYGFVKAKSTNSKPIWLSFSSNGLTFTDWIKDINKGDTLDLDGLDIDTLRFQCESAGDDVIVMVI